MGLLQFVGFIFKFLYHVKFFRPEKEGSELMRAALPHLRLLSLSLEQHSLLAKYLTAEEKSYFWQQVYFKEDSAAPAPPSLNTNTAPREKAFSCTILELIPEDSIITDHVKMMLHHDLDSTKIGVDTIAFYCTIVGNEDFCLKSMEILTQANRCQDFRRVVYNNSTR